MSRRTATVSRLFASERLFASHLSRPNGSATLLTRSVTRVATFKFQLQRRERSAFIYRNVFFLRVPLCVYVCNESKDHVRCVADFNGGSPLLQAMLSVALDWCPPLRMLPHVARNARPWPGHATPRCDEIFPSILFEISPITGTPLRWSAGALCDATVASTKIQYPF